MKQHLQSRSFRRGPAGLPLPLTLNPRLLHPRSSRDLVWTVWCAGEKVIVFGHHKKVLDGIQEKLGGAYQAVRIDGSTSMEGRKQAMDSFQRKRTVRLAILSITAAGVHTLKP